MGLARNCAHRLPGWFRWMHGHVIPEIVRELRMNVQIVLLENGSFDKTRAIIDEEVASSPLTVHRVPVSEDLPVTMVASRTEMETLPRTLRFCRLRNEVLRYVRGQSWAPSIRLAMWCDVDLDFTDVDARDIVEAMRRVQSRETPWVAGASTIRGMYYDTFAYRDSYCTDELADAHEMHAKCFDRISDVVFDSPNPWISAEAAFGGVAIYFWPDYRTLSYYSNRSTQCEHVPICRKLGRGLIYARLQPRV